MKVRITVMNERVVVVRHRAITLRGGRLEITPNDDTLLQNLITEPIDLQDGTGDRVVPAREPERFLRNLWRVYKGSYVHASAVEE